MSKTPSVVVLMFSLFLLLCSPLLAQSSPQAPTTADVNQRVTELEKQIEAMRAELAALKEAKAATPATPAATTSPTPEAKPGNAAAASVTAATPEAKPPAPLEGLATVLKGATVNGLVDTYYTYNFNQPANRTTGLRAFDFRTNQFGLNLIELGLVKTPDATNGRLGYNFTFGFGDAINVVNSTDPGGLAFAQYLKEGYLSYLAPVGKGLQFDVGKFVTPAGAEVIESNANWNYSRSLLFTYAIPFYHFGARTKYVFNDKYSLTGYVVNGWNNIVDNSFTTTAGNSVPASSGKTGGLSFGWNPSKKVSLTETWLGGPGATPADGNHWRNLSDTVLTYTPNSKLSLMANADYGRSEGLNPLVVACGATCNQSVDWFGVAAYLKYQFDPKYAVAGRYEYYDDHGGLTTAFLNTTTGLLTENRQHINEITGTVERRFAQHMISRFEYRYDNSSNPAEFPKGASRLVNAQSTVEAGLIFVLEPEK